MARTVPQRAQDPKLQACPAVDVLPGEDEPLAPLLARCVAGDDTAIAAFISRYSVVIQRVIANKLASMTDMPVIRGDVEDIRNELLARILADGCRMLVSLKDPRRINAWLVVVTRNYVVDYVRKWSSRMRAQISLAQEDGTVYQTPAEQAMERELASHIRKQIQALPAGERLVLELYYVQGLKYAEIAELTSRNINTIAAQLRRAKAKLRKLLEEGDAGSYFEGGRPSSQPREDTP